MKKVLIVEDDTINNNLIKEALEQADYECLQSFSGTEALLLAEKYPIDVVVLDLMLPGLSGEEVLQELKKIRAMPVLVLSAKSSLESKLDLLRHGAQDYMTKPFSIEELIARVDILARLQLQENQANVVTYKDLAMDFDNFQASIKDHDLALTKSEFRILELLVKNPNQVFSKQNIYDAVWDDYYIGGDKTINVHMSNIRKKIKEYTDEDYIETVWGIGFKLHK